MFYNAKGGDLVIANGGTTSNAIEVGSANAVTIYAPATLTGNAIIQVSPDNVRWFNVNQFGASVLIPAGTATALTGIGAKFLRLLSDAAEGAERTFLTTLQELGNRA